MECSIWFHALLNVLIVIPFQAKTDNTTLGFFSKILIFGPAAKPAV
jgi:hypothetical protein